MHRPMPDRTPLEVPFLHAVSRSWYGTRSLVQLPVDNPYSTHQVPDIACKTSKFLSLNVYQNSNSMKIKSDLATPTVHVQSVSCPRHFKLVISVVLLAKRALEPSLVVFSSQVIPSFFLFHFSVPSRKLLFGTTWCLSFSNY